MKSFWLVKNNTNKLILFFNGWGMDEQPFSHLSSNEYDVITFYDYSDFSIDEDIISEVNEYDEIVIISFSMGVYVGCIASKQFKEADFAIAINGTLNPIDDLYGIPVKNFDFTLKTLSDKNLKDFYRNMFNADEDFESFWTKRPKRDLQNQKDELLVLKNLISENIEYKNIYDLAIISTNDKIFPPSSQKKYWQNTKTISVPIDEGHYPFYNWEEWEDILT
jgi:biotin synthesis protein BioG